MKKIRVVLQGKDDDGCGAACVAMLARKTYKQVCKKLYSNNEIKRTSHNDLKRALAKYRIQHSNRFVKAPKCLKDLKCIAVVAVNKTKDGWHWVVFDGKKVLDPSRPADRYKNKLRPKSYLKIHDLPCK